MQIRGSIFIWGGSRLRSSLPQEIAKASNVVGFERAEIWMGNRNAENYQSQERVRGISWVEILSFQAKDDLCLSQARIWGGTGYFSTWWDSRSRPEHPHKIVMQRSSFREPAAAPEYGHRSHECHGATLPLRARLRLSELLLMWAGLGHRLSGLASSEKLWVSRNLGFIPLLQCCCKNKSL